MISVMYYEERGEWKNRVKKKRKEEIFAKRFSENSDSSSSCYDKSIKLL